MKMMMRTGLVFVLLLCLCTNSFTQECRPELLENVDFPGTDIKFVYSPDAHHCQQMCTQHHSCLFFTYVRADWTVDQRHHHCYLKSTPSGQPDKLESLVGVTSGYALKSCPQTSAPCFDQVYTETDFPGADYRSLFTADYEECQRVCTQDPHCQFFTWVNNDFSESKIRYKCHLKFSWTVVAPPAVKILAGVVSGFSSKAEISLSHDSLQECQRKYLPGIGIDGNKLLDMPAASPEHCQILCSAHPSCTYFSYQSTTCFIKHNSKEMVTVAKEEVTSGFPSRSCQQDKNWLSLTYEGKDFPGDDMRFVELDDAESCQRACNEDSNCLFYTYVTNNFIDPVLRRRCYLKRVITIPTPPVISKLPNVVSGFTLRNCAGSSAADSTQTGSKSV